MDIETLVKSAKSGDENAFCELMKINKEILYKTAYLYTKNKHDSLGFLYQMIGHSKIPIFKMMKVIYMGVKNLA